MTTAPRIHLHVLIDVRAQSGSCDYCGARHRVHGYQGDPGRVLRILPGFADDHERCGAGRGTNGEDKR